MIEDIADALSESRVSLVIGDLNNSVYVLQTVHIIAIAFLMLASAIIILRATGILGPSPVPGRAIGRHRTVLFASLGVLVVSGFLLVLSDPHRTILTTAFQVKMGLVLILVMAATVLFRPRPGRDEDPVDPGRDGRIYAVVAPLLIVSIIFLGRWIGYS